MTRLLNEWNSSLCVKEDYIHEICRYGGAEIPSIAAFIGNVQMCMNVIPEIQIIDTDMFMQTCLCSN